VTGTSHSATPQGVIRALFRDAVEMTRAATGDTRPRTVVRTALLQDGYALLVTTRVRETARQLHVPLVNRALRLAQTALYGIEIGKDVQLGRGVYFVHTVGNVVGGNAVIGDRVRFMGNVTVGTARDDGYPVIEDDVVLGAGARVLGPIRVGAGAVVGANSVVLHDVPRGAVVVGSPARVVGTASARLSSADP